MSRAHILQNDSPVLQTRRSDHYFAKLHDILQTSARLAESAKRRPSLQTPTVVSTNEDGTVNLKYRDGDSEEDVNPKYLRKSI